MEEDKAIIMHHHHLRQKCNTHKSIFNQCKVIIDKEKNGQFIYETDGLIFTPIDKSVGSTKLGVLEKNKTWNLSFKWKPPKYNTIDFLITTKKNSDGTDFIGNIFNYGEENEIKQYKTLILRVGYDEKKDVCEGKEYEEMVIRF